MSKDTWKGCTPDGLPPRVGAEYRIAHSRRGTFFGRVVSADENTWATVEITDGVAQAMRDCNIKLESEQVTVRSSHCTMMPTASASGASIGKAIKFRILVRGDGGKWWEDYERRVGERRYVSGYGDQPTFFGDIEAWGRALIEWFNKDAKPKNRREFVRAEMA